MLHKILSVLLMMLILVAGCTTAPAPSSTGPSGEKALKGPSEQAKAPVEQAKAPVEPAKASAEKAKSPAEEAKPAAAQPKPAPKPASAPSGTLVSAISSFAEDQMDPIYAGVSSSAALLSPIFARLLGGDDKGKIVPEIAETWTLSPDGKTWTFKLRKDVKFHNGDPLTSADVKFSLERTISQKSRSAPGTSLRRSIDRVEAPDPYTVLVHLKNADVEFLNQISHKDGGMIMPKKYIEEKGEEYFGKNPVGAGPWKIVKHEPGTSLELEAVKDHWNITPAFQKLVIRNVPEASVRLAMLKRGEADIIDIDVDNVKEVKDAGLDVRGLPYPGHVALDIHGTWLNTGQATMDVKVRQALTLAINREEMVKDLFLGYGEPQIRAKMFPHILGWDPAWKPIPYDPQKAKALLAEAGYPGMFKDPVVNLLSFRQAGAGWLPQIVEVISGYWEAIGVKTKITPVDAGTLRTWYSVKPVPDPKVVGAGFPQYSAGATAALTPMFQHLGSTGPIALLRDSEWEAIYRKAISEADESKRVPLIRQLVDRGHEQYVLIPLIAMNRLQAVSNKVGAWRPLIELGRMYETVQHK